MSAFYCGVLVLFLYFLGEGLRVVRGSGDVFKRECGNGREGDPTVT